MKREEPKLIEEVFAMRPFWGWRRAIEAAGLTYDRILVHLEQTVECLACGIRRRHLGTHVRKIHGFHAGDYLEEFPGAHCASESLRAVQRRGRSSKVPDWEPLWSAEYVIDRIRLLHDRGFPVNVDAMQSIEPTLPAAVYKFWGAWDAALVAAGLDPAEIRLAVPKRPYPAQDQVIRLIRERSRRGLPINTKAVFDQDSHLMAAAVFRFGTWRQALREAGFDPASVTAAKRSALRFNARFLRTARQIAAMDDETRSRELKVFRQKYRRIVYHRFGGWVRVARLIGVPPHRIRLNHSYTPEEVLRGLKARKRAGLSLMASRLHAEDRPLEYAARRHFGSLQAAYDRLGWNVVIKIGGVPGRRLWRPQDSGSM